MLLPGTVWPHVWNMTRLTVDFEDLKTCEIELEVDLTAYFNSGKAYYEITTASAQQQAKVINEAFNQIWPGLRVRVGEATVEARLMDFSLPEGDLRDFGSFGIGMITRMHAVGQLPDVDGEFWLKVLHGTPIEYPMAITMSYPALDHNMTRWVEVAGQKSRTFPFQELYFSVREQGGSERDDLLTTQKLSEGEIQLMEKLVTVWNYFRLGFRHIFPDGTDHMLFVLGLFFLGISWRKLLTQTTVFTIAHTITLGLSAYDIFSLPPWLVEPAIALSIVFVAVENIYNPELKFRRLIIVFLFGLLHGLGFAGSLNEVSLPQEEFLLALLGFNFGVDAGQLFIIGVALLLVGWFNARSWYRLWITVPACVVIALIGGIWSVERIYHYAIA